MDTPLSPDEMDTELLDDAFNPVTTDDFGDGIIITTYNPGNTNTATIQVSIPHTFTAQHIRFTANISGETYYGGDAIDTITINLSDYKIKVLFFYLFIYIFLIYKDLLFIFSLNRFFFWKIGRG